MKRFSNTKNKLKILFCDSPLSSKAATVEVKEFIRYKKYPIGILSIMTYMKKNMPDCQVKYVRISEVENEESYMPELKFYNPDIIGFPCYSYDFYLTYQLIKKLKRFFPKSHICCGAAHVNFFPKETISLPEVDSIVMGDGEEPFLNLCNNLLEGVPIKVNGVYTKESLKEESDFTQYFTKDLNELPIPDIKLLDDYLSYTSFLTHKPLATIVSSKGCPFVCNYCSSKSSRYRVISIKKLIKTISYYFSLGVYDFEFFDETFNSSINRLKNFAEALKKEKLPITFAIRGAVAQHVDFESLKMLKSLGLKRIQFGVETTSERLLKVINKRIDKRKIFEAFSLCNKLKISSVANMMIGLPTQTETEILEDFKCLRKLGPTYISTSIFNYAPHTEFYSEYLKKNRGDDFWRSFARNPEQDILLRHCEDNISRERLYQLQDSLTRRYYFRPLYLLKYLTTVPKDELIMGARVGLMMFLNRNNKIISRI